MSSLVYTVVWQPDFFVQRTTKTSRGKQICTQGNYLLQQWCEHPKTRGGGAGVTSVPRFEYIIQGGKETCLIPKKYCDAKGVSYSSSKDDCYVSEGQKAAEFVSGKVFVRSINVSDKRLKINIKLFRKDFAGPGIHLYQFLWSKEAEQLYGNSGLDIGFIADDLEKIDTKCVYEDLKGYKNIDFEYIPTNDMKKVINFLNIKKMIIDSSF